MSKAIVTINPVLRTAEVLGDVTEKYARKLCNDKFKMMFGDNAHTFFTSPSKLKDGGWAFYIHCSEFDVVDILIESSEVISSYIDYLGELSNETTKA